MQDNNPHIVQISGSDWYVETKTGFDGPFDSKQEANEFQNLIRCSNAARIEFAGLAFSPND